MDIYVLYTRIEFLFSIRSDKTAKVNFINRFLPDYFRLLHLLVVVFQYSSSSNEYFILYFMENNYSFELTFVNYL